MCRGSGKRHNKMILFMYRAVGIFRLFRRYTVLLGNASMVRTIALILVLLFCGNYIHSARLQYLEQFADERKTRVSSHAIHRIEETFNRRYNARDISTRSKAPGTGQTAPSTVIVPQTVCDSEPGFISVRADKRWKLTLASKYDELVSSIQGDFSQSERQTLDYIQAVPNWPPGLENQTVASYFLPIVSQMEYRILIGSFYTMAEAIAEANITFFLYGGSHLGAYRHHGLVPWDDDVDVMFNVSDKGKIKQILSNIPYYTLFAPANRQWKFYETSLMNVLQGNYKWPFIDLFFFDENSTHIWDSLPVFKKFFTFKKNDVFPLTYRPFENGVAPVPRRSEIVLRQNYDIEMCNTNYYWHKSESLAPKGREKKMGCAILFDSLPFVFRRRVSASCVAEELKRGNKTLSRFVVRG